MKNEEELFSALSGTVPGGSALSQRGLSLQNQYNEDKIEINNKYFSILHSSF